MVLTRHDIQNGALTPGTAAYALHFPPLPGRTTINVQGLWARWQPSQRDNNIHRPAVANYRRMIQMGQPLPAITIENIIEVDEELCIRTADGRHRITAAHEEGVQTIEVLDTDIVRQIKQIWNI